MAAKEEIDNFCSEVGTIVLEQYECEDGTDLCFNLVHAGVIDVNEGKGTAARIVAQHILQA